MEITAHHSHKYFVFFSEQTCLAAKVPCFISRMGKHLLQKHSSYKKFHVREIYRSLVSIPGLMQCTTLTEKVGQCLSQELPSLSHTRNLRSHHQEDKQMCMSLFEEIQPQSSESKRCALLLLLNLAEPQWVSVSCNKPLLSQVVCQRNLVRSFEKIQTQPTSFACHHKLLKFKDMCLKFNWFHFSKDIGKPCTATEPNSTVASRHMFHEALKTTFEATNIMAIKVFLFTMNETVGFQRRWLTSMVFTTNHTNSAVCFVCFSKPTKVENNESQVSTGVGQTPQHRIPGHNTVNPNASVCSPLHYWAKSGGCKAFVVQTIDKTETNTTENSFQCFDKKLHISLLDDLIPDCKSAEDEVLYKEVLLAGQHYPCETPGMLHCVEGHPRCYNWSSICLYTLDKNNRLVPCHTGSHIQSCEKFDCNSNFKCPSSFCIPWEYTCDGKLDCPEGHDEVEKLHCRKSRICVNLFKCKRSQICLHYFSICDGEYNCPFLDDEYMCALQHFKCPHHCSCLYFAILCSGHSLAVSTNQALPHVSYVLTACQITTLTKFPFHPNTIKMNLSRNVLTDISKSINHFVHLVSLDLSFNDIASLEKYTFVGLLELHFVVLSHNAISYISTGAFKNLTDLYVLNLENNSLSDIAPHPFQNVRQIDIMLLSNNHLTQKSIEEMCRWSVSVKTIHTSAIELCCFVNNIWRCLGDTPWYDTCSRLLSTKTIQICMSCLFLANTGGNFLLFLWCYFAGFKTGKPKPYYIITGSVVAALSLCSIYLASMMGADHNLGDKFVFNRNIWRNSLLCKTCFWVILASELLIPSLFSLLSFARLRVVSNPLDSQFKSGPFVLSRVLIVALLCFLLSTFVVSFGRLKFSTVFCIPMDDPSKESLPLKMITIVTSLGKVTVVVFSSGCLWLLYSSLNQSFKAVGLDKKKRRTTTVLLRFGLATLCQSFSWLPPSTVFLVLFHLTTYPLNLPLWTLLFAIFMNCTTAVLMFALSETKVSHKSLPHVSVELRNIGNSKGTQICNTSATCVTPTHGERHFATGQHQVTSVAPT